jgi:hypothetical protein
MLPLQACRVSPTQRLFLRQACRVQCGATERPVPLNTETTGHTQLRHASPAGCRIVTSRYAMSGCFLIGGQDPDRQHMVLLQYPRHLYACVNLQRHYIVAADSSASASSEKKLLDMQVTCLEPSPGVKALESPILRTSA